MARGVRAVRSYRFRVLTVLAVCVATLLAPGCGGSDDTTRRPAPAYLFSIEAGSGSLTKRGDNHLTLRLTGARDYLTQFTDRPLRQAFVVANVDFARRFADYFPNSKPNAVLAYTPRGAQIPASIVLTIDQPRWNAKRSIWSFAVTPILKKPDHRPGGTAQITLPLRPKSRSLNQATLVIDDSIDNGVQGG